jgi:hypothetical protein
MTKPATDMSPPYAVIHGAATVTLLLGGFTGFVYWITTPGFDLNMDKIDKRNIIVREKQKTAAHREHEYVGFDCMKSKGYHIAPNNDKRDIIGNWFPKYIISKNDIDIKQVLADCKECGVASKITYKYEIACTNKLVTKTVTQPWHKCDLL